MSLQAPAEDAGATDLSGALGLTVYVFDPAQAASPGAADTAAGTPAPAAPESGGTQ